MRQYDSATPRAGTAISTFAMTTPPPRTHTAFAATGCGYSRLCHELVAIFTRTASRQQQDQSPGQLAAPGSKRSREDENGRHNMVVSPPTKLARTNTVNAFVALQVQLSGENTAVDTGESHSHPMRKKFRRCRPRWTIPLRSPEQAKERRRPWGLTSQLERSCQAIEITTTGQQVHTARQRRPVPEAAVTAALPHLATTPLVRVVQNQVTPPLLPATIQNQATPPSGVLLLPATNWTFRSTRPQSKTSESVCRLGQTLRTDRISLRERIKWGRKLGGSFFQNCGDCQPCR
jgi:hypothetical protein